MDTIDVEEFAGKVKTGVVTFFTSLVYAKLIVVAPWIAANSFFSKIAYEALEWIFGIVAGQGGLVAFIINTKVYTIDQAKDYVIKINKIEALPSDVSDEEWDKAELEANEAFRNLVNFRR